jgi:hypothetical protein
VTAAVIVAGHAVLLNPSDPANDASWSLLDFQRGEPPKYIEHVRVGVAAAAADPDALLLFSGGQSRLDAGPRSEAQGYWHVAERRDWFHCPDVAARCTTEEFARDSFENLLFGICRFKEFTGRYPRRVTIVSWRFKERRLHLHREAIRWPEESFHYAGANDPDDLDQALAAEAANTARYVADPYSSGSEFLAKRVWRNPFRRQHGYFTSCPELARLLRHEGPHPFTGELPWT